MEYLFSFAVVSVLILISPLVSNISKIPVSVSEMILGMIAFNIGLLSHSNSMDSIAEVGFLFLMLLAGMEVDLKSFVSMGKKFLYRAMTYFFMLYFLTICIVWYFSLPSIFVAAFPVMSLGMIMTLIKDYGKTKPWLDLALKIGIIGELISISVLVVLNGYYSYGHSLELYKTLGILFVFLISIIVIFNIARVVFYWIPQLKLYLIPTNDSNSQDIRFSMMLFFVFLAITVFFKLEIVLGAFVAGMILSSFFKYKQDLHSKLNTLGFGFFVPLFFVHVGSTLDLSIIVAKPLILLYATFLILVMLAIRLIASFVAFKSYLINCKDTLLFAFSASMPLTFLVATATLGFRLDAISQDMYSSLVIGAMVEGILFSIIIKIIHTFKTDDA